MKNQVALSVAARAAFHGAFASPTGRGPGFVTCQGEERNEVPRQRGVALDARQERMGREIADGYPAIEDEVGFQPSVRY